MALAESELVLLTTPFDAVAESLSGAQRQLSGKILVDVTNPITADHRALSIGRGRQFQAGNKFFLQN